MPLNPQWPWPMASLPLLKLRLWPHSHGRGGRLQALPGAAALGLFTVMAMAMLTSHMLVVINYTKQLVDHRILNSTLLSAALKNF